MSHENLRRMALAFLGALLMAGLNGAARAQMPTSIPAPSQLLAPDVSANSHSRGPQDAPVVVVEYSDFQCPYCGPTTPQGRLGGYGIEQALRNKYGDRIRLVYKEMPLTMHPMAMPAARYFEAAWLQSPERAWQLHDRIFENQARLSDDFIKQAAGDLGLDVGRLAQDASGAAVQDKIDADMAEAGRLGIIGTPGFIINGYPIKGAFPIDYFEKAIDRALASPTVAQAPAAQSPEVEAKLKELRELQARKSKQDELDQLEKQIAQLKAETGAPAQGAAFDSQAAYSSDVDAPNFKRPKRPDDWALVVGIESYQNDLPKATFAERDADTVRKYFLALGVPEENIIELKGSRATQSTLKSYLEDYLPRNVGPRSRVFFYYSGHGAPDPESGTAYLVPWEADPQFIKDQGFPVSRLYEDLAKLKARQVLVAMDSCFSGAGGRSVLAHDARPLVTIRSGTSALGPNTTLLAAARGDEITGGLDDQGHGLFTYFFLKGLRSGAVDTLSLYGYLKPKVEAASHRQNRDQEPVLAGADLKL